MLSSEQITMPNAETDRREPAIRVSGVGKRYRLYASPLERLLAALTPWKNRAIHEFWALRGLSVDVYPGESIGILGRNGSGKSTLLQLVAGILQPSEGTIETRGRISALLELGSGFNPQLTGRENVFIYGNVLGIPTRRIHGLFEDIAAFADIGAFIDQPVKNYSSGMLIRLAFAVAVAVQPEILIVDEALAVGDIAFQRKCFRRIEEMREAGLTLLFVTHDPGLVRQLCSKALVLHSGKPIGWGDAGEMADLYLQVIYSGEYTTQVPKPAAAEAATSEEAEPEQAAAEATPAESRPEAVSEAAAYEPLPDDQYPFSAVPDALRYDLESRMAGLYRPSERGGYNCMPPFELAPGQYHLEVNLACETKSEEKAVEIMVADWKRSKVAFGNYPPLTCDNMAAKTLSYDFLVTETLPEAEVRVTNLKGVTIRLGSIGLWRVDPGDHSSLDPVVQTMATRMLYFDGREVHPFETAPLPEVGLARITTQDEMLVERAAVFGPDGQPRAFFRVDDEVLLVTDARFVKPLKDFSFGFLLRDKFGQEVFGRSQTNYQLNLYGPFAAGERVRFKVKFKAILRQETYFISFGLSDNAFIKKFFYGLDLVQLPLHESDERVYGIVNLPHQFEAERLG